MMILSSCAAWLPGILKNSHILNYCSIMGKNLYKSVLHDQPHLYWGKMQCLLFVTAISLYRCFFLGQIAEAILSTHQSKEQNDCAPSNIPECCPKREGPVIIDEGENTKLLFCPTSCQGI